MPASLIRVGRGHVSVNRLPVPAFCLGLAAALSVAAVAQAPRPDRALPGPSAAGLSAGRGGICRIRRRGGWPPLRLRAPRR
jgi:hypothetical protein